MNSNASPPEHASGQTTHRAGNFRVADNNATVSALAPHVGRDWCDSSDNALRTFAEISATVRTVSSVSYQHSQNQLYTLNKQVMHKLSTFICAGT